jgi:ribosomal protein L4
MNKKERRLALATALQSAAADVVVVDSIAGAVQVRGGSSSMTHAA